MSIGKINSALVQAFGGVGFDIPVSYELRKFDPPARGPWVAIKNFPADKYPVTLGAQGEDNVTGFFQVTIYVPENDGIKRITEYVDSVIDHFKIGRRFHYQGQEVRVRRVEPSPFHKVQERHVSTVSIYWDSRTQR